MSRFFALTAAELSRLHEDGMTLQVLADLYLIGIKQVRARFRAFGIPTTYTPKRRWSSLPDEVLRRLYIEEGESTPAIGARYGVSHTAVCKRLRKIGIPRRPKGGTRAAPGSSLLAPSGDGTAFTGPGARSQEPGAGGSRP